MAVTTSLLTANFYDASGLPLEGVVLTAVLRGIDVQTKQYVVEDNQETTSDATGTATLTLFANASGTRLSYYRITATAPDGTVISDSNVSIPATACNLADVEGNWSGEVFTGSTSAVVSGNLTVGGDATVNGTTNLSGVVNVSDANLLIKDDVNSSKIAKFEVSGLTGSTTRTFAFPDANTTLVGTDASQTLTNKTLTLPVISTISNTGILTLPTATDTLVGRNTTDTLTNKTLTAPTINGTVATSGLTLPAFTGGAINGTTIPTSKTLVTLDDTQTLTNKTLTSPTITGTGTIQCETFTATGSTTLGDNSAVDGHAINGATTLAANSSNAALTITQTGAGNALVVEDSASTDSTPFVIDQNGISISGHTAAIPCYGFNNQVEVLSTGNGYQLNAAFRADAFAPIFTLAHSRNATIGSHTVAQSGDEAGNIAFACSDGTQFIRTAQIQAAVDGTPGTNDMPGRLVFSTTADGASTPTERLRIDSNGAALYAKAVRATITTDNDLSFDMNAASNFQCTPTAGGTLTFTNITAGQSGWLLLINNSNYAISAAATTKVGSSFLSTVSATGTYLISYFSNGTNVYCTTSGALA
jgi:hypothetical protein